MLPKITGLSKDIVLPVDGRTVRVYAYNIRENKNLILSKGLDRNESENDVEEYLMKLISDKVPGVDINDLTMTDIMAIFIMMAKISKGTVNQLWYQCLNVVNGEECNTKYHTIVDISEYKITGKSENHKLIPITDTIKIEFVYPTYRILKSLDQYEFSDEIDFMSRLCSMCIYAVYDGDEVYTDYSDTDKYNWLLGLPLSVLDSFKEFVDTMPKISLEWTAVCPKCHAVTRKRIESIVDFFMQSTQMMTK